MRKEHGLYAGVYAVLVALTALTAASATLSPGRALGVAMALSIASMKAALIAFYFMHLRTERALIWGIAVTGAAAVLILALGILPDIALRL